MNSKRILGEIITLLGIVCLICMAVVFIRTASDTSSIKLMTIFGASGLVFFISGLSLKHANPLH